VTSRQRFELVIKFNSIGVEIVTIRLSASHENSGGKKATMMHQDPAEHESVYESRTGNPDQLLGTGANTHHLQGQVDWRRTHQELTRLAKCRAGLDWEEGRVLLDALRSGTHLHLGFGSFGEYIERMLGYRRRSTDERLRVAEALETLPELARALRDGQVTWSIARELTRVATPKNERAWMDVARGRTVRQVEELVAGHRPGDGPEDGYDASFRPHVLRFEVSAETFATFREAMAKLRREAGSQLDDDAALLLLARQILGGPADEGRSSYQIGLTVCEGCRRGWQHGRGDLVEVEADIVEMAGCDAQHLGVVDEPTFPVDVDQPTSMAEPTSAEESTSANDARSRAHVGARAKRARQNVPPAVRRRVIRRDGGRCVVPGCRQGVFIDVHHVVPRSEGGNHDPDTLVVLCSAHHRALHRGQLLVEGRISTGLIFRHADGTTYGQSLRPLEIGLHEEAFRALRAMGFRETEARRGLERVRASPNVGDESVPGILRHALALLTADRH
jgi:5-methylcytosine-specific restriction endonuclease McrA